MTLSPENCTPAMTLPAGPLPSVHSLIDATSKLSLVAVCAGWLCEAFIWPDAIGMEIQTSATVLSKNFLRIPNPLLINLSPLISGRLFNMINRDAINRSLARFQFQTDLILQCVEQSRPNGI